MIEVFFLGTGAAIPSRERGHTHLALRYQGDIILFDCGENCQRLLIGSKLSPMKIDNIFLTHLHADHIAGLVALPQSLYLMDRVKPLNVYGPPGTKKFVSLVKEIAGFNLGYDLVAHEITPKHQVVFETDNYQIESTPVKHFKNALACCFKEKSKHRINKKKASNLHIPPGPHMKKLLAGKSIKIGGKTFKPSQLVETKIGKKIVYSGDTAPCSGIRNLAKNADLLIHESTYASDREQEAHKYDHSTAADAGKLAAAAKARQLALLHISSRYRDPKVMLDEAKLHFNNVVVASDGDKIVIK